MQEQADVVGFLLVDKPNGMTSSDCVQEIRSLVNRKTRVGHAGTLDAFATGLLVLGIGRAATKKLSSIMTLDKTYEARARLGQLTDTLDITGRTVKQEECNLTRQQIEHAIASFGTGYKQIPPVYSALKYQGKALSRHARIESLGEDALSAIVQEKSRDIKIYSCELLDFQLPFFSIKARVSHGTYIRSFMNDIAEKCGSFATTHELRRTAIGPFDIKDALPLKVFKNADDIKDKLISLDEMDTYLGGSLNL
jgi:tRNA pseudouridine55 synthase